MLKSLLLALFLAIATAVMAVDAPTVAVDPELEKRVVQIAEELRCLVCQNQNIADSHAELAIDLKNQVRDMVRSGKTDQEIKSYMVQRYGDFVLYRPPVKTSTWLLWVGPFVLLVCSLAFLFLKLRQRGRKLQSEDRQLSAEQQSRANAMLGNTDTAGERK